MLLETVELYTIFSSKCYLKRTKLNKKRSWGGRHTSIGSFATTCPEFKFQAHHLHTHLFILELCYVKRMKIDKTEAGICPYYKNKGRLGLTHTYSY